MTNKYTAADAEIKDRIYSYIANRVREERGGDPLSREVCKEIFNTMCDFIFAAVVERGAFRFPAGLGVLIIRRLKPTQRVLPNGSVVALPDRPAVRYNEGSTVKIMLNKRDKYQERKEEKTLPTLVTRPPRR